MARKRPTINIAREKPQPRTGPLADNLIGDNDERPRLLNIPIEQISADPNQPRQSWDNKESLDSLAKSIKETNGVIQPIEVVQFGRNQYRIVHGERRWRASKLAEMSHIQALVRRTEFDQLTLYVRQLVENMQREDLNDVDRAAGLVHLRDLLQEEHKQTAKTKREKAKKISFAQVAEKVGYSRQRVNQLVKLLNLPEEVQASIIEGSLSERDTRLYHNLNDRQIRALHRARVVDGTVTQAELKRVADYIKRGETNSVEEAIEIVHKGHDRKRKTQQEQQNARNTNAAKALAKATNQLVAENLSTADAQSLLELLQPIQQELSAIIDSVTKQAASD